MSRNRQHTNILFVHCSATSARQDIGVKTINKWHLNRGIDSPRGLSGYHLVGRRSGAVEIGRDLNAMGAQVLGWNDESVGYCLVGGARKARDGEVPEWDDMLAADNFTPAQMVALECWIRALLLIWPNMLVVPHFAVSAKACPSFDVWKWQLETFGHEDSLRFKHYSRVHEERKMKEYLDEERRIEVAHEAAKDKRDRGEF